MVVDGPPLGVVAKVRREPGGHGRRAHRPPLPLQEEGSDNPGPSERTESVWVNRVKLTAMAKVPRGTVRRVELDHFPVAVERLPLERRHEPVNGFGVPNVPQELPAPGARYAPPFGGRRDVGRSRAPPPACVTHGRAVPPGQQRQSAVRQGESAASLGRSRAITRTGLPNQAIRPPW